jgi:hypothetical protein
MAKILDAFLQLFGEDAPKIKVCDIVQLSLCYLWSCSRLAVSLVNTNWVALFCIAYLARMGFIQPQSTGDGNKSRPVQVTVI